MIPTTSVTWLHTRLAATVAVVTELRQLMTLATSKLPADAAPVAAIARELERASQEERDWRTLLVLASEDTPSPAPDSTEQPQAPACACGEPGISAVMHGADSCSPLPGFGALSGAPGRHPYETGDSLD